ncbi:MAG: hypothetical protein H6825_03560 [Planctomycetes bacterium]|nr:hypothetical protein [Planctomycetota bacterium]
MIDRLELRVPDVSPGDLIVVVLNPTRTELLGMTSEGAELVRWDGRVVALRVSDRRGRLGLDVERLGEPVSLRSLERTTDRLAAERLFESARSDVDSGPSRRRAHVARVRDDADSFLFDGGRDALAQDAQARMEAFFLDYDEATQPRGSRRVLVLEMQGVLERRIARRWTVRSETQGVTAAAELPTARVADVLRLSRIQLGVMRRHYGLPDGTLDLAGLRDAFRMFAAGRLGSCRCVDGRWPARPDSAYAFLFAEFGWLVIDLAASSSLPGASPESEALDRHACAWRALMPSLLEVQILYRHSFGEPSGSCSPPSDPDRVRSFSEYGPSISPGLDDDRIHDLLDGYDLTVDPLEVHTRNLWLAFQAGVDVDPKA